MAAGAGVMAAGWMRVRMPCFRAAVVLAAACGASGMLVDGQEDRRPRDPAKVHDPSTVVVEGGVARTFCTGRGIWVMREEADGSWRREAQVFRDAFPAWHRELVPANNGHLWAPDVVRVGDRWLAYYSVSSFGSNESAIGLAAGGTVDPQSDAWGWEDRGPVLVSRRGDRFNAIDPAVLADADGRLWMAFGSFWDGIHLVELDPATGLRLDPDIPPKQLAWAEEIEAPFIHRRGGWYYLFVNLGRCCRGLESTYEIRVGRSRSIEGPYVDDQGGDLRRGAGTVVLESDGRFVGPGHASILERDGREWLVHHFYDREIGGRSRLRMVPLEWADDGWPAVRSGEPPEAGGGAGRG